MCLPASTIVLVIVLVLAAGILAAILLHMRTESYDSLPALNYESSFEPSYFFYGGEDINMLDQTQYGRNINPKAFSAFYSPRNYFRYQPPDTLTDF